MPMMHAHDGRLSLRALSTGFGQTLVVSTKAVSLWFQGLGVHAGSLRDTVQLSYRACGRH
jgi:hypothetical protein